MPSKYAASLKPCDREDCHCDGVDRAGWHVSLVEMKLPTTEEGIKDMARDYFSDLGMEPGF